jgi:hypothetical protein
MQPSYNIEIVFELQALCCLSYVYSTPPPVVSEAERHPGQAVKVSLLFIVAETAAILIFYYKGLDLLSPRCGCFILSFLALNCILLTKTVKAWWDRGYLLINQIKQFVCLFSVQGF